MFSGNPASSGDRAAGAVACAAHKNVTKRPKQICQSLLICGNQHSVAPTVLTSIPPSLALSNSQSVFKVSGAAAPRPPLLGNAAILLATHLSPSRMPW